MNRRVFLAIFSAVAAILLVFILAPLLATIFSTVPSALAQTFSDPEVSRSIGLTFGASGIATVLVLFTGLPLAYLLARTHFPGKRVVESVVDLPIVIPHTAAGIALLMVFGSQGLFGRLFAPLGLVFVDNLAGIVAAMAFVSLPYLVNLSREAFALIDPELERSAMVDGASAWQTFWYITLPQARNGVVSGVMMMWARGISEFGAVVILAYHPKIVPVLIFERFEGFGLSASQPVAVFLILAVLVVFVLLRAVFIVRKED